MCQQGEALQEGVPRSRKGSHAARSRAGAGFPVARSAGDPRDSMEGLRRRQKSTAEAEVYVLTFWSSMTAACLGTLRPVSAGWGGAGGLASGGGAASGGGT